MSLNSGEICTATDVCKIIKACKESNVSFLEFGNLKLNFGEQNQADFYPMATKVAQAEEIGDNIVDYLDEKEDVEQFAHDMEEMKIVDPLGYEKFLREEDVTHA